MKKDTMRTLLIIVGVLVLLAVLALGSAVWLFTRSFEVSDADATSATTAFDEVRSRFGGVTPVLEVRDRRAIVARKPPAETTGTRLSSLRIIAWDPDDGHIARIDLPFWLLRLKAGPIEISADGHWMSDADLGLTVEDLERYGPTLVLDHAGTDGGHVLVWTE